MDLAGAEAGAVAHAIARPNPSHLLDVIELRDMAGVAPPPYPLDGEEPDEVAEAPSL